MDWLLTDSAPEVGKPDGTSLYTTALGRVKVRGLGVTESELLDVAFHPLQIGNLGYLHEISREIFFAGDSEFDIIHCQDDKEIPANFGSPLRVMARSTFSPDCVTSDYHGKSQLQAGNHEDPNIALKI